MEDWASFNVAVHFTASCIAFSCSCFWCREVLIDWLGGVLELQHWAMGRHRCFAYGYAIA
jgi:hypothetical protein